MSDHLSIEVMGLLRGAADGPLAISTLGLIMLGVLSGLWLRRR
jgi:hypothetical protein